MSGRIYGICYTCDSSKPVGQRLAEVKLAEGRITDLTGQRQ